MPRAVAQRRRRGQRQNTSAFGAPAPIQGLQVLDGVYNSTPEGLSKAIWLYNLIPSEFGCNVRKGTVEVATGLKDSLGVEKQVRTVALYNSQVSEASGGNDYLLAMTDAGIYDITAEGNGPWVPVQTWPVQGGDAGWCSTVNFTNVNADHFMLIFDEVNGYYIMEDNAGVADFRRPTGFQPADPDPEELVQGVEWQGRMWFVQRDSASAWYTKTVGGIEGDLVQLNMGSRFFRGGHLVQLSVWTVDDGAGMDDKLVAISSSGDVVIWSLGGSFNPDNPDDLRVEGRWSLGKTPAGRRCMSEFGGDVLILTSLGVVKLTALLGGQASINDEAYVTKTINRYIRPDINARIEEYGWEIELDQQDGLLVITRPNIEGFSDDSIQYVMALTTGAWTMFRNVDMVCVGKNNRGFLFGTSDGRVMEMKGTADDVSFAYPPYSGTWDFEGESDGAPAIGEFNYTSARTTLRINQTDGAAADRALVLSRTPVNSVFRIISQADPDRSIDFRATDDPNDSGAYFTYAVIQEAIGLNGPPNPGEACTLNITPSAPAAKTITFSLLTHYTHLGEPATWKRAHFVRPSFIGDSRPVYGIQARYDFDIDEVESNPPYLTSEIAKWDAAIWNLDNWGGDAQSYIELSGLAGMGRHIAIAMRGETADRLSLIGFDIMFDRGGML